MENFENQILKNYLEIFIQRTKNDLPKGVSLSLFLASRSAPWLNNISITASCTRKTIIVTALQCLSNNVLLNAY